MAAAIARAQLNSHAVIATRTHRAARIALGTRAPSALVLRTWAVAVAVRPLAAALSLPPTHSLPPPSHARRRWGRPSAQRPPRSARLPRCAPPPRRNRRRP
eukprot:5352275-Prymnesium_polylepis.1